METGNRALPHKINHGLIRFGGSGAGSAEGCQAFPILLENRLVTNRDESLRQFAGGWPGPAITGPGRGRRPLPGEGGVEQKRQTAKNAQRRRTHSSGEALST